MADLILSPNIDGADDFYAELIAAHDGLEREASDALNARLVLILSNRIGDRNVLTQALTTGAEAGKE